MEEKYASDFAIYCLSCVNIECIEKEYWVEVYRTSFVWVKRKFTILGSIEVHGSFKYKQVEEILRDNFRLIFQEIN